MSISEDFIHTVAKPLLTSYRHQNSSGGFKYTSMVQKSNDLAITITSGGLCQIKQLTYLYLLKGYTHHTPASLIHTLY